MIKSFNERPVLIKQSILGFIILVLDMYSIIAAGQ